MEDFFHRNDTRTEVGQYRTEFTGYVHQPMFERVTRLCPDHAGGNKLMRPPVRFDDAVSGFLRPAIYSDNPHAKDLASRSEAERTWKNALGEHFLLIQFVISIDT